MSWLQVSVCWWSQVGAKTHIPVMLVNFVWSCELIIPSCSVLRFYDHKLLSFFISIFLSHFQSYALPPAYSIWVSIPTPGQGPRLRRNLTPYHLAFFFFSQPFQLSISVIPDWSPEPPKSILVLLSYSVTLYYLQSPLLLSLPFKYLFSSWTTLIPSFPFSPLHLCPSHGES